MRRNVFAFVLAPLLFGCSEYEFEPIGEPWPKSAPVPLESPMQLDRLVQVTVPAVDVLWVVDNSCSMVEEQTALADNIDAFMGYFIDSGLDWHVGVVSTDMTDPNHTGRLRTASGATFLDETSPTPLATFRSMAEMGITGSIYEKGRAAAYTALETLRNGYNSGFYRDHASLSVIVISDEDDDSGSSPISQQEFVNWLLNLKYSPDLVSFSSIVAPVGGCSSAPEAGIEYLEVTEAVGGISWSICNSDWAVVLDELGMQAAGLKREFFLSELPVVASLEVWVEDEGITYVFDRGACEDCYEYSRSRNSIRFNTYVPEPLAEIYIEYDVLAAEQDVESDDEESDPS
jgi:hypothetical protein